jgi:hypothetical protein
VSDVDTKHVSDTGHTFHCVVVTSIVYDYEFVISYSRNIHSCENGCENKKKKSGREW